MKFIIEHDDGHVDVFDGITDYVIGLATPSVDEPFQRRTCVQLSGSSKDKEQMFCSVMAALLVHDVKAFANVATWVTRHPREFARQAKARLTEMT